MFKTMRIAFLLTALLATSIHTIPTHASPTRPESLLARVALKAFAVSSLAVPFGFVGYCQEVGTAEFLQQAAPVLRRVQVDFANQYSIAPEGTCPKNLLVTLIEKEFETTQSTRILYAADHDLTKSLTHTRLMHDIAKMPLMITDRPSIVTMVSEYLENVACSCEEKAKQ